jgi:hypothetical protein
MPFDTLSDRLRTVATQALAHCKARYGHNGLKVEEGIDPQIGWRPTFFLKPSKFRIIAVEVEDLLYPEGLKGAAHDISHYDFPISVYQACSLDAYQADPKQERIGRLKRHGFGIMTVDDAGVVVVQHACIPLMQFIPPDILDTAISKLKSGLKVRFRDAYESYCINEGQGLQQAGQLVEALVLSIAKSAVKSGAVQIGANEALATVIDKLYAVGIFSPHRAALGGARDFVKEFRNTASHAPRGAKQAAEKIRKCRIGFLDSVSVCEKLQVVAKSLGYTIKINV